MKIRFLLLATKVKYVKKIAGEGNEGTQKRTLFSRKKKKKASRSHAACGAAAMNA